MRERGERRGGRVRRWDTRKSEEEEEEARDGKKNRMKEVLED